MIRWWRTPPLRPLSHGPRTWPAARRPVIAGLGLTELGKVYGRTSAQFAADAVRLAVADAGLRLADVDGLLTSSGVSGGVSIDLQRDLGLTDLRLLSHMQAYGSTAGAMVQFASMAVQSGMASVVACVFADSPLRPERGAGAAYGTRRAPAGLVGAARRQRRDRREPDVRAGRPAAHGAVRDDQRAARPHRRRTARRGRR